MKKQLIEFLKEQGALEKYAHNITSHKAEGRLSEECTKEEFMKDPEGWLNVAYQGGHLPMIDTAFIFQNAKGDEGLWHQLSDEHYCLTRKNIKDYDKGVKELEKEVIDLHTKLEAGRHYLMSVQRNEITVEDALEAFGFGKNGLWGWRCDDTAAS